MTQNRLTHIPPIDRESTLSKALREAGITEESAISMSEKLPSEGNLKSLFDLQLLMFNLKDITDSVTIPDENFGYTSYTKITLIDNLHLVFPTIHKTQNKEARQPDLFFSEKDIETIREAPDLQNYLARAMQYNLKRFLGITLVGNQIQFDEKILSLFDGKDVKKLDFAKVLSRALQAAILFNIFGDQTEKMVQEIAKVIRKKLPYLGFTPIGKDMILGSLEMQAISRNPLTEKLAGQEPPGHWPETMGFNTELDASTILNFNSSSFQIKERACCLLVEVCFCQDGTLDNTKLQRMLSLDPSLVHLEGVILKALEFLSLEDPKLAILMITNLRNEIPYFGFSACADDRLDKKNQSILSNWIEATKKKAAAPTEFPFQTVCPSSSSEDLESRGRRARAALLKQELAKRADRLYLSQASELTEEDLLADLTKSKLLIDKVAILIGFSETTDPRYASFKALGLVNGNDEPLWTITPTFHPKYTHKDDLHKPKAPYLTITDMLGKHAAELMTGPAMNPDILKRDQETVKVYFDSHVVQEKEVQRFITHTLAVTTDGDHQVVRANGTQYCRTAHVPDGGNIQFNAGNEMYDFRRVGNRSFFKNDPKKPYKYKGGYSLQDLQKVQDYDALLLSDEERRLKSEGLIIAGYITITAKGGYGPKRTPLDKAHRVLFIDTCGAQFEKYREGEFIDLNQNKHNNELEAADFIIKNGAQANKTPLISDNGAIPAHTEITDFSILGSKDWSKEYVQMLDGAFFNRQAFQKAVHRKLSTKVMPVIQDNLKAQPFYLKATLFGGGFFAKTKDAGDLREEVTHAMVSGYVKLIQEGKIPQGSVIEFPRYGKLDDIEPSLKEALLKAHEKGIEIVWSEEGDLCDFEGKTSLSGKSVTSQAFEENGAVVLLNAGDAMSWKGNESSSASVESMIGNNSNLRAVFNWWANPRLLEPTIYKKLS